MTPNMLFFATAAGLACTAVLVSAFAVFLAQRSFRIATAQRSAPSVSNDEALNDVRREIETLSLQLREMQRHQMQTPPLLPSGVRRDPSLNVSKRSRAIRMHRLGESPEKIAAELGLSRQEIELLLKVHRLVIASA
jgi:DNA-binding NarL/FixJ family response regulator